MPKIGINIATGSLQKPEIIVGIDLGTTNSLVAFIHPETKRPVALKEHNASSLVPSVVYFGEDGTVVVGEAARDQLVNAPERTIFSAKRLMGKSYDELKTKSGFFAFKIINDKKDQLVKVQVGEQFYSPVDLSSLILKELKARAEHILKTPVNKAVITVPAFFNDAQRQATRDAGKLAGLDVLRIVNEPTAASLAYGLGIDKLMEKTIAVYDLGGGTFDISILRINNGIFEVLATNGDTFLGGDDIDQAIVQYWMTQAGIPGDHGQRDPQFAQAIRLAAELAKVRLSADEFFEEVLLGYELSLTREMLNQLAQPLVDKTLACCSSALKDAGLAVGDIEAIVMVGGSTRVPLVKESISAFFGKPVNDSVNPDEVVALGAAIQADILAGNNREFLLLDVTPLSLGIETMGGLMDVLIPRNAKIPHAVARQYTTQKDGQSGIKISVYQGERDMVKDNRKLAAFDLTGIPGMPAGLPKVEVSFTINADGILQVKAKELRSGISQSIEVKSQLELTDETLEKMLQESITHAGEDIATRALVEARTEGEQLLSSTEKFIQKNQSLLTPAELAATAEAMQSLQLSLTMNDKDLIHTKVEALNDLSRPYAERILNNVVAGAMKGKSV